MNSLKSGFSEKLDNIIWYCIIIFAAVDIFSIAVVQILAAVLMLLFIIKRIITGKYSFVNNPLNIPYLVFISGRLISVFLSTNFQTSYPSLYKEIAFYFIFFVLINEIDIKNRSRVILLLQIVISSACIAAVYGMSVYFFVDKGRITSTASGYYTLGMYLTAVFSLTVMLGRHNEIFFKRFVWWLVNLILVAGILLTFDRLHWFAMTVSVIIAGILKERKLLILYFVFVAAAVLFYPSLYERLMMAVKEMNFSERNIIWEGAFMLIGKHPIFGFGTGTFREIFPLYGVIIDKGISSWHNDYLQLYMESGLIGLVAFIYLIVSVFVNGFKSLKIFSQRDNLKKINNFFYKDLNSALMLAVLSFLIGGFILDPITTILFVIFLAVMALLIYEHNMSK